MRIYELFSKRQKSEFGAKFLMYISTKLSHKNCSVQVVHIWIDDMWGMVLNSDGISVEP